jgi:RNA polymerase sigma-70 factor, ECF subfamily
MMNYRDTPEGREIECFVNGEARALVRLHELLGKKLYGAIVALRKRRRLGADELYQEVWRRAAEAAPRFQYRCRVLTWMLGLAARVCQEERRRKKPIAFSQAEEDGPPPEQIADRRGLSVPDLVEARERARDLYRALDSLPEEERETFLLHEVSEQTFSEIAHALGLSERTVYRRYQSAVAALRRALARWGPEGRKEKRS